MRAKFHADTEELIREIADKGNLEVKQARILWQIITDCMVEHVAVHFKSVDLGFAMLHPCPYRANWKNYLIQRFGGMGQWIRGKSRAERERILRESGMPIEMQDVYLMAVRGGVAYFGLEVVPKRSWWFYMLKVQKRLLAAAGPVGYLRGMGRIVSRLKERMIESHFSHLHQIALPCGKKHSGRYWGGNCFLAENRERKKVRPSSIPVRIGPLYQPNDPTEMVSSVSDGDVDWALKGMPQVSPVQSQIGDVRDCAPKQEAQRGAD